MHIPDGLLSAPVCAASAVLSAGAVGAAGARSRALIGTRAIVWMGVTAAFLFAAQMINFPVASGTSGHLIGGVLAAALLGPSAAAIVMTSVLIVQCFLFADGGAVALGANVLNMGLVQPVVGFVVYRAIGARARSGGARQLVAIAFGSWVATVVAAAVCAGELALSGVVRPGPALAAMLGVHAVIGLGEAGIAALVLATILRLQPELAELSRRQARGGHVAASAALGLAVCLGLAFFVSPFACRWPDGLEHAVEHLGVRPSQMRFDNAALLPDALGGAGALSVSLAAGAGTALAFFLCVVVGLCLAPRGRVAPNAAGNVGARRR
jgi:cobalt/nickel transport system permease protein